MREIRTLGSVRGAARKGGPYRDRRLLQIGAVLPPDTHQCLPVALGPQQVSTVTGTQEGTKGMDRGHPQTSSVLRPLGLDQHAPHCLMTRMTRAG